MVIATDKKLLIKEMLEAYFEFLQGMRSIERKRQEVINDALAKARIKKIEKIRSEIQGS